MKTTELQKGAKYNDGSRAYPMIKTGLSFIGYDKGADAYKFWRLDIDGEKRYPVWLSEMSVNNYVRPF